MRVYLFLSFIILFQTANAEIKPTVSFDSSQVESITIQTDNDLSFHSKLELIENAQSSIKMVYYIYNNDYTSAFFTEKLLQAVERGVKVEILLDYMTNYPRLDLYSMIERQAVLRAFKAESNGSLKFRFYGRPSKALILTAGLLTTGCGSKIISKKDPYDCVENKLKKIDQQYFNEAKPSTIAWENKYNVMNRQINESGLFLSGLYGQNIDLLSLATHKLQANFFDEVLSSENKGDEVSKEDFDALLEFLNLTWSSSFDGNIFAKLLAKLKLSIAYQFLADDINPISNILHGVLPIKVLDSKAFESAKDTRIKDLDHFSDYTHHKLLLVDGKNFQLGGRNIEDSYHVANPKHTLTTKYLFIDTDAVVKLKQPSQKMIQSFNRLFHYTKLTASINEIRQHAPNDVLASIDQLKKTCNNDTNCLIDAVKNKENLISLSQRIDAIEKDFNSYIKTYKKIKSQELNAKLGVNSKDPYLAASHNLTSHPLHFTSQELKGAQIEYLENLHFDTDKIKTAQQAQDLTTKSYSTPSALSTRGSHKSIHAAIYDSIERACTLSRNQDRTVPVVIHNAYFAPPAGMLNVFSKLSNGEWKCPKLSLEILTNSVETTDLAIINIFGRRSISTFLNVHENIKNNNSSQIKYSEYIKTSESDKKVTHSLHSKVFLMGYDLIVGSANTDFRSYVMDTNNAISIKNSPLVSERYIQHYRDIPQSIEDKTQEYINLKSTQNIPPELLANYKVSHDNSSIFADKNAPIELIDTIDHAYLEKAIEEYSIKHELFTPRWQAEVKMLAIKFLRSVDKKTYSIISTWGLGNEHYQQSFESDLKLCMQNHQPITLKRCEQKLMHGTEWPAFFQRRELQRRNDAYSLDQWFKYF